MDHQDMGIQQCTECRHLLSAEAVSCTKCLVPVPRRGLVQADGTILLNRVVVDEAAVSSWAQFVAPRSTAKSAPEHWKSELDELFWVSGKHDCVKLASIGPYLMVATHYQWKVLRNGTVLVDRGSGTQMEDNKKHALACACAQLGILTLLQ